MSESAVRGVLLGHGDMPAGMVDAVRTITGCDEDALVPISNRARSPESLTEAVLAAVAAGPAIVFTDLPSGSCGFVARRLSNAAASITVISGVNLPLLLDFVMNRDQPLDELTERLLERGRAAIGCSPARREDHGHSAASGR